MALDFPVAPILLGYVLGPLVEENFRRALLLSRGHLGVFFERPISLAFMTLSILLIVLLVSFAMRAAHRKFRGPRVPGYVGAAGEPLHND
jgi:TctA family transporter